MESLVVKVTRTANKTGKLMHNYVINYNNIKKTQPKQDNNSNQEGSSGGQEYRKRYNKNFKETDKKPPGSQVAVARPEAGLCCT